VPPAATTANPSCPSAGAGRPSSRPRWAARSRTRLGRTRRPPPTLVKEPAREHSHRLGPAARHLASPWMGAAGRSRPPLPAGGPVVGPLVVADPGRGRLPGRRGPGPRPRPPCSQPVLPGPADGGPGRRRGRPAHRPPAYRAGAAGPGAGRVHGGGPAGRPAGHHGGRGRPAASRPRQAHPGRPGHARRPGRGRRRPARRAPRRDQGASGRCRLGPGRYRRGPLAA
jgi:hypothetical protein